MQALFDLVHSLAKEEKRLYNLHGRKSRFTHIYNGYVSADFYSKELDREIFAKNYSTFSKAFYSMQKNALMDDILAVLLEYSNSSSEEFVIYKFRAKYEVLSFKGFHDQAISYIRSALDASDKLNKPIIKLRILEDLRDTIAESPNVVWDEYEDILRQIASTSDSISASSDYDEDVKKLKVLVKSTTSNPNSASKYRNISKEILNKIQQTAQTENSPEKYKAAFECEYLYSKCFEDEIELHKRLIQLEKQSHNQQFSKDIQLRIVNLLLESAMEIGDFLLINGLIYKTDREISNLTPAQKQEFLPKYKELCAIYHFYENELPLAQSELTEVIEISGQKDEDYLRYYLHKAGVLIAANLARSAQETMAELVKKFPSVESEITVKMIDLIISIEMNDREGSGVKVQRLRTQIRKSSDSRKLGHIRSFLDQIQKMLAKKNVSYTEIPQLDTEWNELLKPNLWLKAKIENNFYYNNILEYWQNRKNVVKF